MCPDAVVGLMTSQNVRIIRAIKILRMFRVMRLLKLVKSVAYYPPLHHTPISFLIAELWGRVRRQDGKGVGRGRWLLARLKKAPRTLN
jgi:hypothetical protein